MNIDEYLHDAVGRYVAEMRSRDEHSELALPAYEIGADIARRLLRDVIELNTQSTKNLWVDFQDALAGLEMVEAAECALQVSLVQHLLPSFDRVAKRCWELGFLAKQHDSSEGARRFLRRVSRCYLLDLVPECLVMCRAALENAVIAKLDALPDGQHIPKAGPVTMRTRLDALASAGWLSGVSATDLHTKVWSRGSKAAHADPEAVGSPLESIGLTLLAIAELSRKAPSV